MGKVKDLFTFDSDVYVKPGLETGLYQILFSVVKKRPFPVYRL